LIVPLMGAAAMVVGSTGVAHAAGAQRWVSPAGNDVENDCTASGNPCKTI
jgi:hypothetical protein